MSKARALCEQIGKALEQSIDPKSRSGVRASVTPYRTPASQTASGAGKVGDLGIVGIGLRAGNRRSYVNPRPSSQASAPTISRATCLTHVVDCHIASLAYQRIADGTKAPAAAGRVIAREALAALGGAAEETGRDA